MSPTPPSGMPKPFTPQSTQADDSENKVADILGGLASDSIALRQTRREVRPSVRMRESLEYLNRTQTNMATTE